MAYNPCQSAICRLPPEIRTQIYDLIFDYPTTHTAAFTNPATPTSPHKLNPDYRPSHHLQPLLTNRQFHRDAHLLAYSRTLFVVHNPYLGLALKRHIQSRLPPHLIAAIRHLAFVADGRHFRQLRDWTCHPLGLPQLRLEELSIVLHRSSYWHYLFDFNVSLVTLLRSLEGVERLTFVRNEALIKGTLLTWYNRLVKLMLKTDAVERLGARGAKGEGKWWDWEHCEGRQTVSLVLGGTKMGLGMEEYEDFVRPLCERLLASVDLELEDPDPMSRVSA